MADALKRKASVMAKETAMERYFFHLTGDRNLPDMLGTTLASATEAKAEGIKLFASLMARAPHAFGSGSVWAIEIVSVSGEAIYNLVFAALSISTHNSSPSDP